MGKRFLLILFILQPVLIFSAITARAQQPEFCTAIVEQALEAVENNCGELDRNNGCYGYSDVQASFTEVVEEDFFTQPSDRAELVTVQTIRTAPLDEVTKRWGIAVLNVQANVPDTLPGQAVIFMLLGDTDITNRVESEQAFNGEAVPITIETSRLNVRSGPGTTNNVIGSVTYGTQHSADALNNDRDWVRIDFGEGGGWISREYVVNKADLAALPSVEPDESYSPMQAFYFTTGIGEPRCNQAPNNLLIQSPRGLSVDLSVNGANITVGSTIVLATTETTMTIHVLDGQAIVNNRIVQAGQKATVPIGTEIELPEDEENQVFIFRQGGLVSDLEPEIQGEFDDCVPLSEDDLFNFAKLPEIPEALLHYPITLPIPHANCISPDSLFALQSQASAQTASQQCSLVATSPVEGMSYGGQTFYWDPLPQDFQAKVSNYEVVVYNESDNVHNRFTVSDGSATNLSGVIGGANKAGGLIFSWTVSAKDANDNILCTSQKITLPREGEPAYVAPAPDAAAATLSASWYCVPSGSTSLPEPTVYASERATTIRFAGGGGGIGIVVSWSGASPTDTILLSYSKVVSGSTYPEGPNVIGSGSSGSHSFSVSADSIASGTLSTTSGGSVSLPAIAPC